MEEKLTPKLKLRKFLATLVQSIRNAYYRFQGYDFHPSVILERNLNLDRLNHRGIHIGKNTLVASHATIMSHDHVKRVDGMPLMVDTSIGEKCLIGIGAFIMPGVKIGDEVIVGAGAVVTKDVPSNCIVAGNPAKIIKSGIIMNERAEWENWPGLNIKDGEG
ncbi:MAG: acyltransferase [Melioribacter sp.]|nr:acyltransferase [Melioribacter sp.]